MASMTDNAVCIRRWDYSETSQTVSLFTREHGLIRGLAKGAKREKSPFSGGFDVLTRGQVVAIVKSGVDLATVTSWSLLELFPAVHRVLAANRRGLYMAELAQQMMHEHDPHPRAFDAMVDGLRVVGEPAAERGLLRYQWVLLEEAGFRPELDMNLETGAMAEGIPDRLAFSPGQGGLVTDNGMQDRWRVRRETIDMLRLTGRGEEPVGMQDETARRANRLLAAYARHILGREGPAMRWAYPDLEV